MSNELPPEVYKVIGAPGTGKTTRVVGNPDIEGHTSLVQQNLEEYSLDEQMIVTYTNAGVDEAADRLERILDEPRYKIDDRVTTIHGQCFRTLGLSRDDVVSWWDKKKFCDTYDLTFRGGDDDDDIMSGDKAEGDSFFDIYGWLKSNRKEIHEYEDCPQPWTGDDDFRFLAKRWEDWKDDNGLIDFSDMIEEVVQMAASQLENLGWGVLFPDEDTTAEEMFKEARTDPNRNPESIRGKGAFVDTKVLYVDEVQDLTPLQWAWYLAQKLACEKVYIGGDDDQTIYGWAGANPDFMLDEEGDFEVLDKTYRIPANVWETCDGVINQVDKRQEKEVTPHGDGGEVIQYHRPSPGQIAGHIEECEGDVFILFRAKYMIDNFTEKLHERGIPYDNMSTFDTWDEKVVNIRNALAKIHRYTNSKEGKTKLSGDEVDALLDNAPESAKLDRDVFSKSDSAMANFTGISASKVVKMIDLGGRYGSGEFDYKRYLGMVDDKDKLNHYQKEAIKGNIRNENTDMDPEKVRIGTIHSSKGKEANTVILGLDTTATIAENMAEDTENKPNKNISDAERRVYYVGMTRASQRLVLCEKLDGSDMSLSLDDLLADEEEDKEMTEEPKPEEEKNETKTRRF